MTVLLAFDALFRERQVTRAATRIGLTQSALSHALRRLRVQFEDPLFTRGPGGMVPTARAHSLAAPLGQAMALLQLAHKLVFLALDEVHVVVGQLAPLLFHFAGELLPVAFDAVFVHGSVLKTFRLAIHPLCVEPLPAAMDKL